MSGGPLRVLLLTKGLGLGGAERVLLQTAETLNGNGCDCALLSIDMRCQELVPEAMRLGLPTYQLPFERAWTPWALWRCLRWMRAQRIDLIHAHLPLAGVYGRILGRLYGCPVVYSEHSLVTKYRRLTHCLNRLTYGANARVIAVSQAVQDSVLDSYGPRHRSRLVVIENGVDTVGIDTAAASGPDGRAELGLPADARVVGTVASFRPVKRIDLLLRAFARVALGEPRARLLLVGSGSNQPELAQLASELGLSGRVLFTGLRHDAMRLMRCMDVFVICSDWEGLPMALLEAMTLARPIVATRVGGIPEVVEDGRNGRLIEPGDELGLTRAIADLLASPETAATLGRSAREAVAAKSGSAEMAKAILGVYRQVVYERTLV